MQTTAANNDEPKCSKCDASGPDVPFQIFSPYGFGTFCVSCEEAIEAQKAGEGNQLILPAIDGERAWDAADRAAGAIPYRQGGNPEHFEKIAQANRSIWARITSEAYWEALGVVPPIYIRGGFHVGECVCAGPDGDLYLTILGSEDDAMASYQVGPECAS